MAKSIFLITTLATLIPPVTMSGYTSRYDDGVFESTVSVRQEFGQLPAMAHAAPVFLALESCDHIGEFALVRPVPDAAFELAIVADCAGDIPTVDWMRSNGIIAEVDYDTYARWSSHMTTKGMPIEVSFWPRVGELLP